jgi:F0F1-type ATP synthase assembly protein I
MPVGTATKAEGLDMPGYRERLEGALYRRGLTNPGARQLVGIQLSLTAAALLAAAVLGWRWRWPVDFAAGAVLASFNFYFLAIFAQRLMTGGDSRAAVPRQLFRFYGRLFVTGVFLAVLLAWLDASAVALLAGLSTVLVSMLLWGAAQTVGKNS